MSTLYTSARAHKAQSDARVRAPSTQPPPCTLHTEHIRTDTAHLNTDRHADTHAHMQTHNHTHVPTHAHLRMPESLRSLLSHHLGCVLSCAIGKLWIDNGLHVAVSCLRCDGVSVPCGLQDSAVVRCRRFCLKGESAKRAPAPAASPMEATGQPVAPAPVAVVASLQPAPNPGLSAMTVLFQEMPS
eukprot:14089240-Alexandrium_andersonii.AAC.1